MNSVDVTQRIQFTCDYLVRDADHYSIQPCLYTVDVTVRSCASVDGRVIEFAELKDQIEKVVPNNKFIVGLTDNRVQKLIDLFVALGVELEYVSFDICAENICAWIADMLQGRLYLAFPNIFVAEVVLNENGFSTVRWRKS